jgi:hypothetical protein
LPWIRRKRRRCNATRMSIKRKRLLIARSSTTTARRIFIAAT